LRESLAEVSPDRIADSKTSATTMPIPLLIAVFSVDGLPREHNVAYARTFRQTTAKGSNSGHIFGATQA